MAIPHEIPLIATVSVGLGLAFVAGFIAMRFGLPPLLGYLVAGVVVGPFTPGFVADAEIAKELAEIGVILLMFGVGTHFSVRDLWAVRRVALPGAIVQIGVATALGAWLASAWGWPLGGAIVFGLALSVASTVVMLKALQERGLVDSVNGRIAVGWLVVEDLAMVLALVLLPAFAGYMGDTQPDEAADVAAGLGATLGITFLKIGIFFGLMYLIGLRLFPWLSRELTRAGSGELATLFVAAVAISLAFGAATAFSVSFALGAFLAGVIINEAGLTSRVTQQVEVLEHVFAALFFVSVGMLFNPQILLDEPLRVLAVLAIIVVGKSLAALAIVLVFRHPLNTALTVSASLAQIGEFSFILAGLGVGLNLLPPEGRDLILAGAILSIALNPLVFFSTGWLGRRAAAARAPETPIEEDTQAEPGDHVVLIGYGRVGRMIVRDLTREKIPLLVIDENRDIVARLRKRGVAALCGDASTLELLRRARLDAARLCIVAIPNTNEARRIFDLVRELNPPLGVVVRVHSEADTEYFRDRGAALVLMAEHELAHAMSRHVLLHAHGDVGVASRAR